MKKSNKYYLEIWQSQTEENRAKMTQDLKDEINLCNSHWTDEQKKTANQLLKRIEP